MSDEKCATCQKPKSEHVLELGALFCYADKRRQEKWNQPTPQSPLFADVHRTTGYEL